MVAVATTHLALATRLKAGILALGHGALQGCRYNALAIEQYRWEHRRSSTAMGQRWCWMLLPPLVVAQYHLQPTIHRSQVIVAIAQLIITAPIHLACSTAVRSRFLEFFRNCLGILNFVYSFEPVLCTKYLSVCVCVSTSLVWQVMQNDAGNERSVAGCRLPIALVSRLPVNML